MRLTAALPACAAAAAIVISLSTFSASAVNGASVSDRQVTARTFAAAACGSPTTMLVGDSLSVNMVAAGFGSQYFQAKFQAAFRINAQRGRATAVRRISDATGTLTTPGTAILSRRPAQRAGQWIVELGTNDTRSVRRFRGDIAKVMSLAAGRQVSWVNVYRGAAHPNPTRDPINVALRRAQRTYPNLRVLDWASQALAHPSWFRADANRVHPNPLGSRALAALIVQANRCR